jgi:hypothetical protein
VKIFPKVCLEGKVNRRKLIGKRRRENMQKCTQEKKGMNYTKEPGGKGMRIKVRLFL